MPRRSRQAAVIPTTALVASAIRYNGKSARIYEGVKDWQREAYRHYRICGEARYAASFYGNALSRATLHYAEKQPGGDLQKLDDGPGAELVADLFKGKDGQAQMLKACGIHLCVAGECYLVGRTVTTDEHDEDLAVPDEVWEIISVSEMSVVGTKWSIRRSNRKPIELTEDDVVIRIWSPDPEDALLSDSPFRSMLPVLSEIEWLTRHIFAQCSSRLAGAGLLFLPQSMSFPQPVDAEGKKIEVANAAEAFMMMLGDAMLAPIEDPSNAAATVPTVVTVPDDVVDKAKLMHFWSDLDAKALEMRNNAIRRFAIGMDLPPEQILGMASAQGTGGGRTTGVSHWGAWQIEESTIKMHLEPTLELIVNAITVGYLRPLNTTKPNGQVDFDTSLLRLRPDRSKEAILLGNMGLLKDEVILRENGFDPTDKPDDAEFRHWLLVKIASGSATPEQVQAALMLLGLTLPVPAGDPGQTVRETRPPPTQDNLPDRPRTPDEGLSAVQRALLAASEGLVYRALERSGNRIRRDAGVKPPGVDAFNVHTMVAINGKADTYLHDAWSCAPQVLDGLCDVEATVKSLDAYVRALFVEKAPHDRQRLAQWLEVAS